MARATGSSRLLFFLYGTGIVWATMFVLPWRAGVIAGALLGITGLLFLVPRREDRHTTALAPSPADLATILLLTVFALFATAAPLWEWDAWAIWALKARIFFEHGGIDWAFLEDRTNLFSHPSYPLVVPTNLALPAVLGGEWSDRWLGLHSVAFAAGAALAVRGATTASGRHESGVLAFAAAGLASSPFVGTAESPLIAFAIAGLILLRNGSMLPAAILLGLAASTKIEGLTLLAAAGAGLAASGRARDIVRLWPSLAIAAPWQIIRMLRGIEDRIIETESVTMTHLASEAGTAHSLLGLAPYLRGHDESRTSHEIADADAARSAGPPASEGR